MKSRKTTFTISGTQSPKLTKLHKNLRGNLIPAGQSGDFFLQKIEEFYFVNIKNLRLWKICCWGCTRRRTKHTGSKYVYEIDDIQTISIG